MFECSCKELTEKLKNTYTSRNKERSIKDFNYCLGAISMAQALDAISFNEYIKLLNEIKECF